MSKYGKIRGAIRWYSRLPKLRKPFFAFLYSRLSTWANAVDEGLNRVRGFNSVSAARYRLSGNPNCELFLQGPIIPVPLSALPHRPVGAVGNTRVVFPGRNEKESPRTRGLEGLYSRYFAGGFALRRCRNSIRRYSRHQNASSEASSRYSHSTVPTGLGVRS